MGTKHILTWGLAIFLSVSGASLSHADTDQATTADNPGCGGAGGSGIGGYTGGAGSCTLMKHLCGWNTPQGIVMKSAVVDQDDLASGGGPSSSEMASYIMGTELAADVEMRQAKVRNDIYSIKIGNSYVRKIDPVKDFCFDKIVKFYDEATKIADAPGAAAGSAFDYIGAAIYAAADAALATAVDTLLTNVTSYVCAYTQAVNDYFTTLLANLQWCVKIPKPNKWKTPSTPRLQREPCDGTRIFGADDIYHAAVQGAVNESLYDLVIGKGTPP